MLNILEQPLKVVATVTLAAIPLLYPQTSHGQQSGEPNQYLRPLMNASWVDDTHYRVGGLGASIIKTVIVDVHTGASTPDTGARKAKPFVRLRAGDIFYYTGDGHSTQLTRTAETEQNPELSPDGLYIAFTRNSDLYILEIATDQEQRITSDGNSDVYNGYSSWVYNEEILGRATNNKAFWWSPDSKHLAFMRFDDTQVPIYELPDDLGVHQKTKKEHYPQPGDPNPSVRVGIASVGNQGISWAHFDEHADQYFGTPSWTPDGQALWVQWMNRRQDTLKVISVSPLNGTTKDIYTEHQSTWIDLDLENRIQFLPASKSFLLLSDKSGWMHLYTCNMEGKPLHQLTQGKWAVSEVKYIDETNGWIFFTACKENSTRIDLYKVKLDGSGLKRLTFGQYNHRVSLSPHADYFITTYSNVSTPTRVALVDKDGKLIREVCDTKGPDFAKYDGQTAEIIRVPTPDGFDLPVRIIWPKHLDTARKYPVQVGIYGGPGFKMVSDWWIGGYTAGNTDVENGLISIQIDHRGSGHFGKEGENYLYRNLGKWEIADYAYAMRWLEAKYHFMDTSRVGISGFSYGGYITCLALVKAPDVFQYGMAGGSVTDWRLYDTHYTERYMGTPKDNPSGYDSASVMTYVDHYKGMLSLAQGTMDDNVHPQNTIQLVSALEDKGKKFEFLLYPGGAHGWLNLHAKNDYFYKDQQRFIRQYLLLQP